MKLNIDGCAFDTNDILMIKPVEQKILIYQPELSYASFQVVIVRDKIKEIIEFRFLSERHARNMRTALEMQELLMDKSSSEAEKIWDDVHCATLKVAHKAHEFIFNAWTRPIHSTPSIFDQFNCE